MTYPTPNPCEYHYKVIDSRPFGGYLGRAGWAEVNIEYQGKTFMVVVNEALKKVSVSDEIFWNPNSATGEDLTALIKLAHHHGYEAGIVITPYALPEFSPLGTATLDKLADAIKDCDFVGLNPYLYEDTTMGPPLLEFTEMAVNYIESQNKDAILVLQGFAIPGTEKAVAEYNAQLKTIEEDFLYGDAIDFLDIPDEWQIELVGGIYPEHICG